jgi:hypothetical protein
MPGLDITGIAGLLGVSRPRVWQLRKQPGFPAPSGTDEKGRDYWWESVILRWAAGSGRLADRAPLLFRPVEPGPAARYFGVEVVRGDAVLSWDTQLGRVCMDFPGPGHGYNRRPAPESLDADAVVTVRWTENPAGPDLEARDAAHPEREYRPAWTDLARILGTPAPWWPVGLRRPADMSLWRPGARPAVIRTIPDVDTTPLLQLAAVEPASSSAHATLIHLARHIQARSDKWVWHDVEDIDDWGDRDAITIAGTPAPASEEPEELDEAVRRDGWLQILAQTDSLAIQCVQVALDNDGGRDFPFSSLAELRPDDGGELAAEFTARLEPCERSAAFALFADDMVAETWTDPQTGLPVARSRGGILRAAVPQRLPATAPLAEVTLDHGYKVWIRTADGKLWLAPEQSGTGLSWGYSGGGPLALAILLGLLLDDINAAAPHGYRGYPQPPGLLAGTEGGWRTGCSLTRADLEAARRDGS